MARSVPQSNHSAHYVIGQDGRIAQLVSEDDTADDRRMLTRVYDHLEA
jgi:N-acetyl-anhydromuramyl-L-alanine amidase AmpD